MANKTKIEWTDRSWNPVTGCSPKELITIGPDGYQYSGTRSEAAKRVTTRLISEGCINCWARRLAEGRLRGRFGYDKDKPFEPTVRWDKMDEPRRWRNRYRVAVALMGDLFHYAIAHNAIEAVWWTMQHSPRQTFQILTKRPERMREIVRDGGLWHLGKGPPRPGRDEKIGPLPNVWLGTTIENQRCHDERVPILVDIPGYLHWLSVEPLLEPITLDLKGIDWVVVGCESGPNRRRCKLHWIGSIVTQCEAKGVPVFIKQIELVGKVNKNPADWAHFFRCRQFP